MSLSSSLAATAEPTFTFAPLFSATSRVAGEVSSNSGSLLPALIWPVTALALLPEPWGSVYDAVARRNLFTSTATGS